MGGVTDCGMVPRSNKYHKSNNSKYFLKDDRDLEFRFELFDITKDLEQIGTFSLPGN